MTKQQEIDHLQAFADSLPKDSYLADWMRYAKVEIESSIRSDIFPTVLPNEAKDRADQIIAAAKADAASIVAKANKESERLKQQAESKWQDHQRQLSRYECALSRYECAAITAAKDLIKAIQEIQ